VTTDGSSVQFVRSIRIWDVHGWADAVDSVWQTWVTLPPYQTALVISRLDDQTSVLRYLPGVALEPEYELNLYLAIRTGGNPKFSAGGRAPSTVT
jgi:hypothetical protein